MPKIQVSEASNSPSGCQLTWAALIVCVIFISSKRTFICDISQWFSESLVLFDKKLIKPNEKIPQQNYWS